MKQEINKLRVIKLKDECRHSIYEENMNIIIKQNIECNKVSILIRACHVNFDDGKIIELYSNNKETFTFVLTDSEILLQISNSNDEDYCDIIIVDDISSDKFLNNVCKNILKIGFYQNKDESLELAKSVQSVLIKNRAINEEFFNNNSKEKYFKTYEIVDENYTKITDMFNKTIGCDV